jgi:alkanesulfonate monooxygenase SsuD/methylene tetrahydromethanopterin reductase-like flavin-dependent oxidoreductase (luciferase family)
MGESRARFDEAADLVLNAMETGVARGDGTFFPQPEAVLHPAPTRGFKDRLMCIAMSPDSLDTAARLGGAMSTFIQNPIEQHAPMIDQWRESFRELQGAEPPAPTLTEFMYCHEDPEVAERNAREYITRYYLTAIRHYEFGGKHFAGTTGYSAYAEYADALRELGNDAVADSFVKAQTWGTPEQILAKIEERMAVVGDYNLNGAFSYGGMPYDVVEASMKLYAEAVIPKARQLGATVTSA